MAAPSATCSQHELREAVGICVRCRAAMCAECITKIDGINHCRRCLEDLQAPKAKAVARRPRLPAIIPMLFGLAVLCALSVWMLDALMPGAAP
jgi:hypothetical protein